MALFLVVDSVLIISGTGCALLSWRYDLCGNSQEGGKQRQKQLQMELRDLLALVMFRQIQFNFPSSEMQQAAGDTGIDKWRNVSVLLAVLN